LDAKKGVFLHGKDSSTVREIASLTKIMTAFVCCKILHELDLNPKYVYFEVPENATKAGGTTANLKPL
jgi:D-alanyl-D-alanine carboxypeptidase